MTQTTAQTLDHMYTITQQAARDYMQAANILAELDEIIQAQKDAQASALDILTEQYGADKETDVKEVITGCWNVPLIFTHQTAATVRWAKVVEALRSHLNDEQAAELDRLTRVHGSTRTTRKLFGKVKS